MSVIIGINPHKALHAACAIDERETELGRLQIRSGPRQINELLAWATPFACRSWAIESVGGLGYLLGWAVDSVGWAGLQHTSNGYAKVRRCRSDLEVTR
jgi:hypothetical protein